MNASFTVFTGFIAYHLPGALLFFAIVWLVMRNRGGQRLQISGWWLAFGVLATAVASAAIRFLAGYAIGSAAVLDLEGGALTVFGEWPRLLSPSALAHS
jgi:hypothetical protein